MNEKTAMNIDLRDVQEKMEDSARTAQDYGRKAVLATIGFWGLAYDKAQDMWKVGNEWVEKAEKRGEELEHEWTQEFNKLQKQPEVKKVVDYVEDQVDGVSKNAKSVVNEVEKFLAQFNPNKVEEVAKDVVIKVESAWRNSSPATTNCRPRKSSPSCPPSSANSWSRSASTKSPTRIASPCCVRSMFCWKPQKWLLPDLGSPFSFVVWVE